MPTTEESDVRDPLNFILWVVVITVSLSVCLCSICGFFGFKAARRHHRKKVKCSMCKLWVSYKDWHYGDHRQLCCKRNEFFWKNLPEPFDIRCPTCLQYLKLLPKVSSKGFTWGFPLICRKFSIITAITQTVLQRIIDKKAEIPLNLLR